MLLNWLSRCWGGMGINTQFQKARVNCSIIDWTVPQKQDIIILVNAFKNLSSQIPSKTAINMLFTYLQNQQAKDHPSFLLKQLYIFDHTTDELTILDTIGYYYNSCFSHVSGQSEILDEKLQYIQLISSYFTYIKTKARLYQTYQHTYFKLQQKQQIAKQYPDVYTWNSQNKASPQTKLSLLQRQLTKYFSYQSSIQHIFQVVDKCIELQKCIINVNKATSRDKEKQLIKYILKMALKTYYKCYAIVSIAVKFLIKIVIKMQAGQLNSFITILQYYNQQYSADFIKFVQSNKQHIQIFQSINYNQFTRISPDLIKTLKDYLNQLTQKELVKNAKDYMKLINSTQSITSNNNKFYFNEDTVIEYLPENIYEKLGSQLRVTHKPRKNIDDVSQFKQSPDKFIQIQTQSDFETYTAECFENYQNTYHTQFSLPSYSPRRKSSGSSIRLINSTRIIIPKIKFRRQDSAEVELETPNFSLNLSSQYSTQTSDNNTHSKTDNFFLELRTAESLKFENESS